MRDLSGRLIAAVRDRRLLPSQRIVFADLIARAAEDDSLSVDAAEVAKATDLSLVTVTTSIARLEFLGRLHGLVWADNTTGRLARRPGRQRFKAALAMGGEARS